MKSELTERKVEEKVEFPKLMESRDGEIVVLFKDSTSGTIVYSNASDVSTHVLGYASLNWCEGEFKDYKGTITLQN